MKKTLLGLLLFTTFAWGVPNACIVAVRGGSGCAPVNSTFSNEKVMKALSSVAITANGGASESVYSVVGFTLCGGPGAGCTFDQVSEGSLTVSVNGGPAMPWVGGCGTACGHASGTLGNGTWNLSITSDTGSVADTSAPDINGVHPWVLTSTSTDTAITSVVILGGSRIVFDRDLSSGGQEGTPGSSFGIDYSIIGFVSGSPFNGTTDGRTLAVSVMYDNKVTPLHGATTCIGSSFPGSAPCGDLWGKLTFAFTGATLFKWDGSTGSNISWTFFQDTDAAGTPEPLSLGLAGIGLLALGVYHRRRSARLR